MGMAASQARLLALTARIHDVEYEAQSIEAAKLQLSTQEDQAYSDYCDALDATTLTITYLDSSANTATVAATFNNLFSINKLDASNGNDYALTDKYGRLIVSNDIFEGYSDYSQTSPKSAQGFAMYMMGIQDTEDSENNAAQAIVSSEESVYNEIAEGSSSLSSSIANSIINLHDSLIDLLSVDDGDDKYTAESIYDTSHLSNDDKSTYQSTLLAYQNMLYKYCAEEIYSGASENYPSAEEYDQSEYSYYVSIYNQIQATGGCISINDSDFTGVFGGDVSNDSDWLQAMLMTGKVTLSTISTDSKTGEVTLNATSPSSDSAIGYTTTTTIDKSALTKAEAEYENTLRQIDKKDKQYDLTLNKLESERTALTTEYDSVKKVIEDNIKRTFGIFS